MPPRHRRGSDSAAPPAAAVRSSDAEFGPYAKRLREQFEGVIRRFRTGGQWREVPPEFGAWSTVHDRFRQWRDAGVFTTLMDAMITEAARRGQVDMSLVGVDSTVVRAHQDAAGLRVGEEVLTALEEAAGRTKGDREKHKQGKPTGTTAPTASNDAGSAADAGHD